MANIARATTLAAAALFLTGCIGNWNTIDGTQSLTSAHIAGSALRVRSDNGSIDIARREGAEVTIRADIRARTQERLDQVRIIAERGLDNTLEIRAEFPGRRKGNEGCDFTITVPEADGVDASSSNGAIAVRGLAGRALAVTSNGAIRIRDHHGDVDADTSNGRIELLNISGAATADTSNGAVTIELAPDAPGPVRADSSNGSITLVLGPAFTGTLDAGTSNGSVEVLGARSVRELRQTKTSARLVVGTADRASRADTSNGSITIRFSEGS